MIALHFSAFSCDANRSDGVVWVEHHSEGGTNSSWWEVFGECGSDDSLGTMSVDNLAPDASESGVVDGVLCFPHISDSLSLIESSSSEIVAVLDGEEGLIFGLSGFSSSESSENSLLVKTNWLSLVVDLLLGCFDFLCHSSLFVIMIIQ